MLDGREDMMKLKVGICIGCEMPGVLNSGVCCACLTHPKRGRKWAEMARKIRTDDAFAKQVYETIETDAGREVFVREFGTPAGVTAAELPN